MSGYQTDFSAIPVSAGRTKALWDAIRTAPSGPDSEDPYAPQTAPTPPTAPGPGAAPQPPVDPASVPPAAGPPSVVTPNGPAAAAPPDPLPSTGRVDDLTGQLATLNKKPGFMDRLKSALPAVLAGGIGALAGGPSSIQGVTQGQDIQRDLKEKKRASLVTQIDAAQQAQTGQYGAQQRAGAVRDAAEIAGRTRLGVADTNADAKAGVADTNANVKRDTTDMTNKSHEKVAGITGGFKHDAATIAAMARVEAAHYTADAAANRQTRSIAAADRRQGAGFDHTDSKPTADEDRRADLSTALKGYAAELRDIAVRRPELFGKVAGRVTAGRQGLGTNDADVRAISRLKEQIGTVALGAHSLRNAGHIATAADKITNINDDAPTVVQNLDDQMKGVDQFQTISRPSLVAKPGAPARRSLTAPKNAPPAAKGNPLGLDF